MFVALPHIYNNRFMLRRIFALLFGLLFSVASFAQGSENEILALEKWRAAEYVTKESVELFGVERAFRVEPISDQIFGRMKGKS